MHVKGIIVNLFQSLEIKNPLSIMYILVGDFQAMAGGDFFFLIYPI